MDSHKRLNVPFKPDEVTPEWLSAILGCKIDSTTLSVSPNAQEDKGYLSELLRIVCFEEKSSKKLNLIVKLLPQVKEIRDVVVRLSFDKTEIRTYKKVIPALISQVPELSEYICPFIYGNFLESELGYSSVLVLEDLKPLNYFTYDFVDNIPSFILDSGIDFLAKLHFAGSALENTEKKKLNSLYPFLRNNAPLYMAECQRLMIENYPILLKKLSNARAEVKEAYISMKPFLDEIFAGVMLGLEENPTIVHTDLWSYNIMCYKDTSKLPKIIDWQMLSYKDATSDLAVFLTSNLPTKDFTMENVQRLVEKYWNLSETYYEKRNLLHLFRRSKRDFKQFFRTFGLSYSLIWFILSMPTFQGKSLERIVKIYEFFHEVGVVSFMLNFGR